MLSFDFFSNSNIFTFVSQKIVLSFVSGVVTLFLSQANMLSFRRHEMWVNELGKTGNFSADNYLITRKFCPSFGCLTSSKLFLKMHQQKLGWKLSRLRYCINPFAQNWRDLIWSKRSGEIEQLRLYPKRFLRSAAKMARSEI